MEIDKAIKTLEELKPSLAYIEDFEAIETALKSLEDLKKENEELKNIDLTTVYLKGVSDEKERWRNKIRDKIEELNIAISEYEYSDDDVEEYKKYVERNKRRLLMQKNILQNLLKEDDE